MSLIRYIPSDVFGEMDDMFGSMAPMIPNAPKAFMPAINMYETENAVVVEAPLAGVRPEDVQVSVQKGLLILKGESNKEREIEEKNYYRKEIRSGSFYREVALPTSVMENEVSAEFADGMLKVTAPKAQPIMPKKIDVKVTKK
jgi:HSP20 family protein